MSSLQKFAEVAKLDDVQETKKILLLAFFHFKVDGIAEFTIANASAWLEALHYARPNPTRLRSKLEASRDFVKGSSTQHFKLHRNQLNALEGLFPEFETSELIQHAGSILPEALYQRSRGFLESLAHQINACYEQNIFDGCAVLMRRMMEILLILSFEHHSVADEIRSTDGTYIMLDGIVTKAKSHPLLKLSRNSRESLDVFRNLGNYSAHKIYYNCKREDIKKQALAYRALVEELFYKSGIRT